MTTLYDFKQKTLEGKEQSLGDYKGKAALVVNVASKCGLTPHYQGLAELLRGEQDRGFAVLGFPCNQFGGQEPGSNADVQVVLRHAPTA